MKRNSRTALTMITLTVAGVVSLGCVTAEPVAPPAGAPPAAQPAPVAPPTGPNMPNKMTFFVTSTVPGGGDLGGIDGADKICADLARAASAPARRTWHAYLSLAPMGKQKQVDARDRIGKGPWYNAKGVEIASSVDDLH